MCFTPNRDILPGNQHITLKQGNFMVPLYNPIHRPTSNVTSHPNCMEMHFPIPIPFSFAGNITEMMKERAAWSAAVHGISRQDERLNTMKVLWTLRARRNWFHICCYRMWSQGGSVSSCLTCSLGKQSLRENSVCNNCPLEWNGLGETSKACVSSLFPFTFDSQDTS